MGMVNYSSIKTGIRQKIGELANIHRQNLVQNSLVFLKS